MNNYAIFSFRHNDGALFERIGANFISRGNKHSQTITEQYAAAYLMRHNYIDFDYTIKIYFDKTNANFIPNQLKVYRQKISGCVSRNIAAKHELTPFFC